MNDRILSAVAAFVAVPTVLGFVKDAAPVVVAGMQILSLAFPVAVATPTGSMNPTIDGGDQLVHDAGVGDVDGGDVMIYSARDTEYVHRAMFHVEKGENWYDRANPRFLGDDGSCEELANCPAPQSGWITKGDANPRYDQAAGRHGVVADDDIKGRVVWIVEHE